MSSYSDYYVLFTQDVPKPAFMLTKKEDDYSEDEVKLCKDYQKKVQELNEEREKYRKVNITNHTLFFSFCRSSYDDIFKDQTK